MPGMAGVWPLQTRCKQAGNGFSKPTRTGRPDIDNCQQTPAKASERRRIGPKILVLAAARFGRVSGCSMGWRATGGMKRAGDGMQAG
jgi:hypothetical protein